MYLMNGNKIVAKAYKSGGTFTKVKAEPCVSTFELPQALFRKGKTEVSFSAFVAWAKQRCFPPEREDATELLKSLGLKEYDPWAIIQITEARLPMTDEFWIDFKH